jgi:hypothetical protein
MVGFNVLAEWQTAGLTGYGEIQDFVDVTRLTGNQGLGRASASRLA